MNQLGQTLFKIVVAALCVVSMDTYGQKQTKTFKETFNVGKEAVLDIDTSHADIVFETWNKNVIQIEAKIEIDGITTEEAAEYFKNNEIEILGNSKQIKISTGSQNSWSWSNAVIDIHDIDIDFPETLVEIDPVLFEFPEIPELIELTAIDEVLEFPEFPVEEFDHSAYQKEGKKYLEKWKKEFNKEFDANYKRELEEWADKVKERQRGMHKERKIRIEERKHEIKERKQAVYEKRKIHRLERLAERNITRDSLRTIVIMEDSLRNRTPNVFYYSTKGKEKNLKVKKTIKIKMPKSAKIKMNVRHGEVKLAENTKNINATLSYTRLLASTIDGDKTRISASYSPVIVDKWNYGELSTSYSEIVDLKEVLNLRLNSTSSEIVIGRLSKSAFITNKMGTLLINSVADNFKEMDIRLQNSELECKLPTTPYTIYVNGVASKLVSPSSLKLERTKNYNGVVHKGFHMNRNTEKSISINSKYSTVVLK